MAKAADSSCRISLWISDPVVGEEVPADEHMVEHLAAALVVQGVSGWGRDGVLDWYQDSTHQVWIAGVFDVAADGHDRDLIRDGVGVARDDDLCIRVGVEDLIDQPANLQGLRHPFHRG
jgi:hypothetical protein